MDESIVCEGEGEGEERGGERGGVSAVQARGIEGDGSVYIPSGCLEGVESVTTDQATSESRQKRRDVACAPGRLKTRICRLWKRRWPG